MRAGLDMFWAGMDMYCPWRTGQTGSLDRHLTCHQRRWAPAGDASGRPEPECEARGTVLYWLLSLAALLPESLAEVRAGGARAIALALAHALARTSDVMSM